MLNRTPRRCAVAGAFLALSLTTAAWAARFGVTSLGELRPSGISNTGFIAGSVSEEELSSSAVIQRPDGELIDLGVPGVATGVNDSGDAVGRSFSFISPRARAFVYRGGQVVFLDQTLGGRHTGAEGINNGGTIVGFRGADDPSRRAFVLLPDDRIIDLGPGTAYAISDSGFVVGKLDEANGKEVAFVFRDANGNAQVDTGELIRLGGVGGSFDAAFGVNEQGQVVGCVQDAEDRVYAVIWNTRQPGAAPTELQNVRPQFGLSMCANDINDSGQVVGDSEAGPFLWENGRTTLLETLIPAQSGAELFDGRAINNQGNIIGSGIIPGEGDVGVLLTNTGEPPAPAEPALESITVSPTTIRSGGRVTVTLRVSPALPGRRVVRIPVTVARDGGPVAKRFKIRVRGTGGAKRIRFSVARRSAGAYTFSATYGGVTKTTTISVSE